MNTNLNKDGQTIGRKGSESRARLLAAGLNLLGTVPVHRLSASAIARAAGFASQSFYLYFQDVDELFLLLCAEAAEDMDELHAEIDSEWQSDALDAHAQRFIAAFYRYWDRHRPVLNLRNFLADNGNARFDEQRNTTSLPLVSGIARHISAAHGKTLTPGQPPLPATDAFARAVIIFAAIERMASRYSDLESTNRSIGLADLKRAEAHILSLLLTRP
ncbi:MAG TPA: TetR/AcrR family transcriptional regulator [Sphingobium sp.]|uniref:TetR/AcrR family transcriptional regulator n=1 Tax=Sphingobium sp. TaxID=1912891 RepID=UPI002ECFD888